MEILLTGATGYIGHVVAEKLVARGDTVIGMARSDAAAATLRNGACSLCRATSIARTI